MTRCIQVDRIRILVFCPWDQQAERTLSVDCSIFVLRVSILNSWLHIQRAECTWRNRPESGHGPAMMDHQKGCVLSDLGELRGTDLFLMNQYNAELFSSCLRLHVSSDQCWQYRKKLSLSSDWRIYLLAQHQSTFLHRWVKFFWMGGQELQTRVEHSIVVPTSSIVRSLCKLKQYIAGLSMTIPDGHDGSTCIQIVTFSSDRRALLRCRRMLKLTQPVRFFFSPVIALGTRHRNPSTTGVAASVMDVSVRSIFVSWATSLARMKGCSVSPLFEKTRRVPIGVRLCSFTASCSKKHSFISFLTMISSFILSSHNLERSDAPVSVVAHVIVIGRLWKTRFFRCRTRFKRLQTTNSSQRLASKHSQLREIKVCLLTIREKSPPPVDKRHHHRIHTEALHSEADFQSVDVQINDLEKLANGICQSFTSHASSSHLVHSQFQPSKIDFLVANVTTFVHVVQIVQVQSCSQIQR